MKLSMNTIVGIVPAAGKGTRLYPFPCPKELFPIGYQDYEIQGRIQKRPKVISQYLIENIIRAGAKKIFIILGEDKYSIMQYYGDGHNFNSEIAYLYQEKIYGMPYAINLAKNWIDQNTVIFGMPDTIIEPKDIFVRLLQYHNDQEADLTLGLFETMNPSKFGMVEINSNNSVITTVDKPHNSNLKYMWGCACWSSSFTLLVDDYLRQNPYNGKELVLGDIFNKAINCGMKVNGLPIKDGLYIDLGTADEIDSALKRFHL